MVMPLRRNSGRYAKRHGAGSTGPLSNWTQSTVGQIMAEMERRRVNDRALDLYTNDGMAHGLLEGLTAETVGIGLTPQLSPDAAWLGLGEDWRLAWQRSGQKLFERWGNDACGRCFSDASGRMIFYAQEALAYFHWKLDGIAPFQVVKSSALGAPIAPALLALDPWRLATPSCGQETSGKNIYDGVEVDANGRPVAGWFRKPEAPVSAGSAGSFDRIPVWDEATGLPRLLLVCGVRHVAEYREDSIFASMISELRNNKDFVDAALVRALMGNMFLGKIMHQGASAQKFSGVEWEKRVTEMEQAMLLHLLPGEDAQLMTTDAPGPNFEKMFDATVKRLGMATSRGAENVSREYKASYSASMMSQNKARELTASEQDLVLNARFSQPALAWMLYAGVVAGHMPALSLQHFLENMHDYCRASWLPQPSRHIDPLKTANAHKVELATGERTHQETFAEKGRDWREGLEQRAIELEHIKKLEAKYGVDLGLSPSSLAAGTPVAPANEPDPDTEDKQGGDNAA
jgi:lambda family phage portal protein